MPLLYALLLGALRGHPRGADLALRGPLRISPRPRPGGGVRAHSRRRARGSTPTDWPSALAAGVSELLVKPLQSRDIAAALARVLHAAQ
jgi:hypothetical protein